MTYSFKFDVKASFLLHIITKMVMCIALSPSYKLFYSLPKSHDIRVMPKAGFISLVLYFAIGYTGTLAVAEEPWSVNSTHAVLLTGDLEEDTQKPMHTTKADDILTYVCFGCLKGYQLYLSPMISGQCPMEPSCSHYSIQAIKKHGPLVGIILTVDRLIHEPDELRYAPRVQRGNRIKCFDPVENNDFWWYRP